MSDWSHVLIVLWASIRSCEGNSYANECVHCTSPVPKAELGTHYVPQIRLYAEFALGIRYGRR